MGNFRSGEYNHTHGRYESTYRVDSFYLAKYIFTQNDMSYSWNRNGKPAASIGIIHNEDYKEFVFCYTWNETEKIRNKIDYVLVNNNYGGSRIYFICPDCGKRVRFLCNNVKCFNCRTCAGLNYEIQQVSDRDKIIIYIEKLLKALKVDTKNMDNFEMARYWVISKPRYMRKEKFENYKFQLLRYQKQFWSELGAVFC